VKFQKEIIFILKFSIYQQQKTVFGEVNKKKMRIFLFPENKGK
jgi:hypothetical protein